MDRIEICFTWPGVIALRSAESARQDRIGRRPHRQARTEYEAMPASQPTSLVHAYL